MSPRSLVLLGMVIEIALGCFGAIAAGTTDSYPASPLIAHESLDDAAISALTAAAAKSRDVEYGGCLYSQGGKFFFTTPVTMGASAEFSANCFMPADSFVGIYHTHPGGQNKDKLFSATDIVMALQVGKVSYIGVLKSEASQVLRFNPIDPNLHSCSGRSGATACARFINEQGPVGRF